MNSMTSLRTRTVLACMAAVAMTALAACGSGSTGSSSSGGTSSSSSGGTSGGETLKIGLLVEQTGQFSWYGTEALDGAKLYVKEHPKAGKRTIEFDTYNTASDPQQAVLGFRKLVQQDHVAAVVGLGLTNEATVVAPLAESLDTPLYVLSGSFTSPNQMTFTMPVQIGAMQNIVFKRFAAQGIKKVALLATNDATGQIADKLFAGLARQYGMRLVASEHMDDNAVDVTPQLTDIEAAHPDLIVAWEIGKPLGVVFSSAHQLGITTPFLISYGNLAPGFLAALANVQPPTVYVQATEDVFWNGLPSSDPHAKRIKAFHAAYVQAYGQDTGLGSASGYDSVMLLAKAVQNDNSTSAADIVAALEKINGVQGVLGTYHMSKTNHVGLSGADTLLGHIKGGKIALVPASNKS